MFGPRPAKSGWLIATQFWRFISCTATVMVFGASCGSPASTMGDLGQITKNGLVRVCSTGDYRPFTYLDPHGQWSGMDIDMAHNLAQRLNVKLDLVQTTWATMMSDLDAKCDIAMGGISITLDRARQGLYSNPYLRDGKAAVVRCTDGSKYQTLAAIDQPGVRVVVNPGGTNADFVKARIHRATVANYPDNNTIFTQLTAGQADVMITDASEIRWQTRQDAQLCGESIDHPFTFEQKAYLVRQSDEALRSWLNEWLNIANNDGTFAAISQNWLGQQVGP
ncbi:transporter substrate-binding domain-containing protein [Mycobacterium sp. Dal123C01]|uniref:transporter substrate-binding domain-containing protein n=1 Tax=Mycobacterium sp. Dal123C01 TaxID=3457577 RepID=UPI00403EF628